MGVWVEKIECEPAEDLRLANDFFWRGRGLSRLARRSLALASPWRAVLDYVVVETRAKHVLTI
jgi:hypothetical protein